MGSDPPTKRDGIATDAETIRFQRDKPIMFVTSLPTLQQ